MPKTENDSQNPLINYPVLPNGAPPFDAVKTEHYLPAMKAGIAAAKLEIEAIKNNPEVPTFKNTIEALEFSGLALSRVRGVFDTIAGANSDDEVRKVEEKIEVLSVKHGNDIMMDAALFSRVKAVYDARSKLQLTSEQKMLLEETYKSFVRSGALLGAEDKQELRDISEKLSELSVVYNNNVVNSTAAYKKVVDNEADLAGVPERVKNIYKQFAEEEGLTGKWLIKLSPPPTDILEYCENRSLREEIYRANMNVAYKDKFDNTAIILEIVQLRQKKAELMGFPNYAAFVLDDQMAKTPKIVTELLEKNTSAYKPAAAAFLQKVKDFALKTDGLTDMKPWDMAMYSRRLKEKTFDLDMEQVRPYFDLEKTLDGLRLHAEKLFGIKITETTGKYPVYHPDVKSFEVRDAKSGEMIGLWYADYYARPGAKNNGAWMNTVRQRGLENGQNKFAIAYNVCNFDKPTKDQPTLLSLREVETVFHEFGHALHALLAEGNYPSLTCTSVKRDFVEMPSQLQENWTKEKEVLDTFAAHYKTGEKIPAGLIKKINDMGNFDAAYAGLRQTFLGLLDMKWHETNPATIKSVEAVEDSVVAVAALFPRAAGPMSTAFGHIFSGGYAAGYYSYKWAEILDADIFSAFKKNGLYDRKTADRLRDTIYSKGGMVDAMELFVQFMGRKPDPDALFRREGILPEKTADHKKPHHKKTAGPHRP